MGTVVKIPFTDNIDILLKRALQESRNFDGIFSGNKEEGNFDFKAMGGRFTGSYKICGNLIEFVFINKPLLIPNILIESFLRKHIK